MRRWTRKIWHYLTSGKAAPRRVPIRRTRSRLELEYLEDRTVLSTANFTGTLTGTAFLDTNSNGTLDKGELAMPGVKVVLSGTLTTPLSNTVTAASWANGVATITTSVENALQVGDIVTISGMTPAAYNGTFTVTKVPSATKFTFALATNPGAATAFGTATETGVSLTTNTKANGTYTFGNVLPGSYTLTAGPVNGLITTSSTTKTIPNVSLTAGQTLTNNIAFTGKLSPAALSLALFLTETSSVGTTFGPVSTAAKLANYRPDSAPTVSTAIANQSVNLNAANTNIDLAGHFTDADYTNSKVTFNITDGTTPLKVVLDLFDSKDPQTVANFFDYINSGSYNNSVFHRLVTSGIDILQGGAVGLAPSGTSQTVTLTGANTNTKFKLTFGADTTAEIAFTGTTATDSQAVQTALAALPSIGTGNVTVTEATSGVFTITFGGTLAKSTQPQLQGQITSGTGTGTIATKIITGLDNIPILSPDKAGVPSEFSTSNTAGTIAMALSGSPSDPNSGTDQFFFNIKSNASSLDSQKFTVFGKIESISTGTLDTLGKTTTKNVSNATLTADFPTADFQNIPLKNYHGSSTTFAGDATAGDFVRINSVTVNKRDEFLSYTATSSDPTLVTASVTNEWLSLHYATGKSGTATITVTATDRFGATKQQTFSVTVNGPTVTGVSFTDNDPSNTNVTTLTANPATTDPSASATVTETYQWLLNGQPIAGANNQTLVLSSVPGLTAGAKLSVQVTPKDSASITGATFTSNTVTVLTVSPSFTLSVPTVSSVAVAADNATNATKLTATPTSPADPQGQPITYSYQWLQNNQPISGATAQALQLSTMTVAQNDTFAVRVTPSDGVLTGPTVTSSPVGVAGTNPTQIVQPPAISSVTLTPSNPQTSATLTANVTASDPQGRTLTYTYVWTDATTNTTIHSTVGSSSASDQLDLSTTGVAAGDTVKVSVTANNGGIDSQASSASVQVVNAPTISNVSLTPSNPHTTGTLTANVTATDPQNRALTYTYVWTDTTTSTMLKTTTGSASASDQLNLSTANVAPGDTVKVTITANNGVYDSQAASTSTQVVNAPTISNVSLTPGNPQTSDTLTASVTASDPQNLALTYTYVWTDVTTNTMLKTTTASSSTSDQLDLNTAAVAPGDTVQVTITANNGVYDSLPSATSVQVVNAPTISGITLTPNNPATTDTLTANVTASDPQNLTLRYTYVWKDETTNTLLSATIGTTSTSDTLDLTGLVATNDTVSVTITANNGVRDSSPSSTSVIVV